MTHEPQTLEELRLTRALARKQFTQAFKNKPVVCKCGLATTWAFKLYRCYYCGVFFCDKCAAEHFGQSREDYNREHYAEHMVPREAYDDDVQRCMYADREEDLEADAAMGTESVPSREPRP